MLNKQIVEKYKEIKTSKNMTGDYKKTLFHVHTPASYDYRFKSEWNRISAVLPTFTSQKSGHIIANSSVAGLKAYPGGAVYGATKWAVRDLMEVLRMESAQEGTHIRTATIYPAAINTELLETITDKNTAEGMADAYERYGITPDRIANVVAFAIDQPEDTNVSEFTIGPTIQPW